MWIVVNVLSFIYFGINSTASPWQGDFILFYSYIFGIKHKLAHWVENMAD